MRRLRSCTPRQPSSRYPSTTIGDIGWNLLASATDPAVRVSARLARRFGDAGTTTPFAPRARRCREHRHVDAGQNRRLVLALRAHHTRVKYLLAQMALQSMRAGFGALAGQGKRRSSAGRRPGVAVARPVTGTARSRARGGRRRRHQLGQRVWRRAHVADLLALTDSESRLTGTRRPLMTLPRSGWIGRRERWFALDGALNPAIERALDTDLAARSLRPPGSTGGRAQPSPDHPSLRRLDQTTFWRTTLWRAPSSPSGIRCSSSDGRLESDPVVLRARRLSAPSHETASRRRGEIYMWSIITCPKPEHDTCVAPSIRRAKS